jgi:hypothetical protein
MAGDIVILAIDSIEGRKEIGQALAASLIICPGIPANIADYEYSISSGTIHVFNNDLETFHKCYLPLFEDMTDDSVQKELERQLTEWGRACDKQSFRPLCVLIGTYCAQIVLTYVLSNRGEDDLIETARYDFSTALPFINKTKYTS